MSLIPYSADNRALQGPISTLSLDWGDDQVKKIKNVCSLEEVAVKDIIGLAQKLYDNSANSPMKMVLVTKKCGQSIDIKQTKYSYPVIPEYKIHMITVPNTQIVRVFVSPRTKVFTNNIEGLSATNKIFTKCARFDVDFEKKTVDVRLGARLRPKYDNSEHDHNNLKRLLARFQREVKTLRELDNAPGVTSIWEVCQYPGSHQGQKISKITYFGELYEGGDLFGFIEKFDKMTLSSADRRAVLVSFYKKMADILISLKQHHYFHGDIKPENILLDGDNNLFLNDFEFAVKEGEKVSKNLYGYTSDYLSPERYRALVKGSEDDVLHYTTDMWAMGILFYEMYIGGVNNSMFLLSQIQSLRQAWFTMTEILRDIMRNDGSDDDNEVDENGLDDIDPELDLQFREVQYSCDLMSKVFAKADLFPTLIPIPTLPGEEISFVKGLYPYDFLYKKGTNLEKLVEDIHLLLSDCDQALDDGIDLTSKLENIKVLRTAIDNLIKNMDKVLNEGWREWNEIPLSDDPLVAVIQRMLKVNPDERITPEELKLALDLI